jgi:farnesyl diphosphate synthase
MRYAALNGGKRLRPVLVYATGEALSVPMERLDAPACAVELVHCYSLVHDDLPAMDDDDLRRGRPTCHKAYDEATAILVGDALQSLAFRVLSRDATEAEAPARLRMIEELALAAGSRGMAGGQALDLAATGTRLNEAELEDMHIHKTGALIRASVRLGALGGGTADPETLGLLDHYAKCIGLAFQVQDDILDVDGDEEVLGKYSGADARLAKPTYPALMGLETAREFASSLCADALQSLEGLGDGANALRDIARYIVARDH